jgi:TetR/AcrR family transcriptional regulator, cholesterol catabolism regulator
MAMSSKPSGRHSKRGGRDVPTTRRREAEVLDTATEIFSQKSFIGTSVQDLADALGILKGSLYYYIDSKDDLLFRILDRVHEDARLIVEETRVLDGPPLERLSTYLERYITFFLENLRRMTLYVREWQYLDAEHKARIVEQRRFYEDFIVGLITESQAAGDIGKSIDPAYAAFFIIGAISSLPDWYSPRGPESPASMARRYTEYSLNVLRAR